VRPDTVSAKGLPVDQSMVDKGRKFEEMVRLAMREAGIESMSELGRESRINKNTWYAWFRGEREPTRHTIFKATMALNRSVDELLAPWDGGGAANSAAPMIATPALEAAIARGVEMGMRRVLEELRELQGGPDEQEPPEQP
jgi:transcriptional regulator with XRE-family HTH domain